GARRRAAAAGAGRGAGHRRRADRGLAGRRHAPGRHRADAGGLARRSALRGAKCARRCRASVAGRPARDGPAAGFARGPVACPSVLEAFPAALVLASVTDTLAEWVTSVVDKLGLPGIFLLMAPESACIPIPSEPTMLFAGFAAHDGAYPWWAAALTASVANVVGSWIAWAAGYYGRTELLERNRLVHINPKHLEWADRFFARWGDLAVFFTRM